MFALIDRTNLTAFQTTTTAAIRAGSTTAAADQHCDERHEPGRPELERDRWHRLDL